MVKLLTLLVVALLLFLVGCANGDGSSVDREEFRERMEEQIAQLDQQIADARERAQELTGEARDEMNQAIYQLEEQRDDLAAKLEEMRDASADEWQNARNEVEEAVNDLDRAFSEFRQDFIESSSHFDLKRVSKKFLPLPRGG